MVAVTRFALIVLAIAVGVVGLVLSMPIGAPANAQDGCPSAVEPTTAPLGPDAARFSDPSPGTSLSSVAEGDDPIANNQEVAPTPVTPPVGPSDTEENLPTLLGHTLTDGRHSPEDRPRDFAGKPTFSREDHFMSSVGHELLDQKDETGEWSSRDNAIRAAGGTPAADRQQPSVRPHHQQRARQSSRTSHGTRRASTSTSATPAFPPPAPSPPTSLPDPELAVGDTAGAEAVPSLNQALEDLDIWQIGLSNARAVLSQYIKEAAVPTPGTAARAEAEAKVEAQEAYVVDLENRVAEAQSAVQASLRQNASADAENIALVSQEGNEALDAEIARVVTELDALGAINGRPTDIQSITKRLDALELTVNGDEAKPSLATQVAEAKKTADAAATKTELNLAIAGIPVPADRTRWLIAVTALSSLAIVVAVVLLYMFAGHRAIHRELDDSIDTIKKALPTQPPADASSTTDTSAGLGSLPPSAPPAAPSVATGVTMTP